MPDAKQHVAGFTIKLDGQTQKLDTLLSFDIKRALGQPSAMTLKLSPERGKPMPVDTYAPGKQIEASIGSIKDNSLQVVFKGEIVAMEPEFREDGPLLGIRAYDKAHRLMRGTQIRDFKDMTSADIVKKVAQEAGLAAQADSTPGTHKWFAQAGESSWDLCRRLAVRHDFDLYVDDGKLVFKKAQRGSSQTVELTYGQTLLSFTPRTTGVQQYKDAVVRGWDAKTKKELVGRSGAVPPDALPEPVAGRHGKHISPFGTAKLEKTGRAVNDQGDANEQAKGLIKRAAANFFEGEGRCAFEPRLKPGSLVNLKDVDPYSGKYTISAVHHRYRAGDYSTYFEITGRSPRTLLDLTRTTSRADWSANLVIGIVTNEKDPEDLGRVKVKYPSLNNVESDWARILVPHAGNNRGFFFLPQVNDEVVVGFEHGDPRRPYVLGCLYNGKEKPPKDLVKDKKGTFGVHGKDNGHIQFDKDLLLKSREKMVVTVEASPGDFQLTAAGKVNQKATQAFEVQGATVSVKGQGSVTVEASGSLTLKGATVDIQGSGPVNIKGAMINLG